MFKTLLKIVETILHAYQFPFVSVRVNDIALLPKEYSWQGAEVTVRVPLYVHDRVTLICQYPFQDEIEINFSPLDPPQGMVFIGTVRSLWVSRCIPEA